MSLRVDIDPPKLNIPELREIGAYYFDDDPDVIYVECEPIGRYHYACPNCGCIDDHIAFGSAPWRRIHDISMGVKSIDIMLKPKRYKCRECGIVFRQPLKFADTNRWITKRLEEDICKKALTQSFSQVAEEFGVTIPTISKIVSEYGKLLDEDRIVVAPRVLGMDENHIAHRMRGIFTDIEKGTLLDMTPDNKQPTMQAAIENMQDYDTNIQLVCMDMSRAYKSVVEMCLPKAKIIVDKFHVVRYIYQATEQARKQIFQQLKKEVSDMPPGSEKDDLSDFLTRMGKDSYLFKFSTKRIKMDRSRASLMARLCKEFPKLNELRITKERAEAIYDSDDAVEAAECIKQFVLGIPSGPEYDAFRKFSRTLNHWSPEVLNYFRYGKKYTNAATEGVNALIKSLNLVGRGYSFDNLRTKALFWPKGTKTSGVIARKKPPTSSTSMSWLLPDDIPITLGVSIKELEHELQILF